MPLIIIKTSMPEISTDRVEEIHEQAETILSSVLKKSRDYVVSILEFDQKISFAGESGSPSAYIEAKNVGILTPEITETLSREITAVVTKNLGIEPKRVYIEFQHSERHMWGWNGSTFG